MDSIIQKHTDSCFMCGRNGGFGGLDLHHVYFGGLRQKSDQLGLTVWLCHDTCHLNGVHKNAELNRKLQAYVQGKAMEYYAWSVEDFRKEFYKSYV